MLTCVLENITFVHSHRNEKLIETTLCICLFINVQQNINQLNAHRCSLGETAPYLIGAIMYSLVLQSKY